MRWSVQELFKAIRYQWRFFYWTSPWRIFGVVWRIVKVIVHWTFYGYCHEIIWDLDGYLMDILKDRITIFRNSSRDGFPLGMGDQEEFNEILDRLIKGFEIMKSEKFASDYEVVEPVYTRESENTIGVSFPRTEEQEKEMHAAWRKQEEYDKETMRLFAKYFRNLWD